MIDIRKKELPFNTSLIDNLMESVFIIDAYGTILYGNKKAMEAYGYTYEELINLNIFDFREENIKEYTNKQLHEKLNKDIVFETFHYKKNGIKFPVEVRTTNIGQESNHLFISIVRDISYIDKILKDAAMFSTSLDILEDALVVFTKDFDVSTWSKGAERKLGYKKEEIIGENLNLLIPRDKICEFQNKMLMVKKGKKIEGFETIRLHKNGERVYVSICISPIYNPDGLFIGALGIYKDISEKRKLTKKLQEHEERWRYALEAGMFGVWDWHLNTNKMICSNLFSVILGYSEHELGEAYKEVIEKIHPDDIPYVQEKINKHFQGEEYVVEFRMKCKNGQYKWIRSKGKVYEWLDDRRPQRMVGTHEDITNRKLIEEKLEKKYNEVELLKEEAIEASKAKSQFLANMSHEIRTPLNGIVGMIQLIQSTKLNQEQQKYVDIIKDSLDVLLKIINDVLDISKIESGSLNLNAEPFDLKQTINSVYNNLLVTGNAKGLEISCYLDPNINFQINSDEIKLKQILNNLITNAVKFTEEGYVSLRTKIVSCCDNRVKIEFKIKDSGIGIQEKFKEKIFENFNQGDLSVNKKFQGTGLGLAISKQLAKLLNGDITFQSKVGEGSTFIFTCEFKKEDIKYNNAEKDHVRKEHIKNKVILCIEDNIINQEFMKTIIIRKGYRYIPAYNGEEALNILKIHKVDLILMDIQLPELSGFEITKVIREEYKKTSHIPIIAMTAYAMHEDRKKCMEAGMDDYIAKPFDLEDLYDILDKYLKA